MKQHKPVVVPSDQVYFFDVDDTLVKWGSPFEMDPELKEKASRTVDISTTRKFAGDEGEEEITWVETHAVIEENVDMIKQHKARGHTVVVWSQGGYEWARDVVEALKLNSYVDLVICKPAGYYDDLPCSEFMGSRKFGKKTLPYGK